MKFEVYGELEYLDPENFYSEPWSIYDTAIGNDGLEYAIVISGDRTELRYTNV